MWLLLLCHNINNTPHPTERQQLNPTSPPAAVLLVRLCLHRNSYTYTTHRRKIDIQKPRGEQIENEVLNDEMAGGAPGSTSHVTAFITVSASKDCEPHTETE